MKHGLALLLALLTVSPAFSALAEPVPAVVIPPPSQENRPPAANDLSKFLSGTQGTVNRGLADQQRLPFVQLLGQDFEGGCGVLPTGWTEEVASSGVGGWIRDCLDPRVVAAGGESAMVKSGSAAASIRNASGGYTPRIDSRLVSPVVDLRWVAGVHADPDVATDEPLCRNPSGLHRVVAEWCANLTRNFTKPFPYSRNSLHAAAADLRQHLATTAGGTALLADFRTALLLTPDEASDLPLVEESLGFGMVNLSFWHSWDWKSGKTNDGGLVEIRHRLPDGTWSTWENLEGDLVFETRVPWTDLLQASGCAAWMDIQDGAFGGSALTARAVVPPLCHSLAYWRSPYVAAEVLDEKFSFTTVGTALGSPTAAPELDADLAQPGLSLSALHSRLLEHRAARGPNGRVDTDGSRTADGVTYDPTPDPAGYVGESGGMVYSKYTLNRYIGKEVQVAFRAFSLSAVPTTDRGWFVDDVQVSALVPTRDIGVYEIIAPRDGDVVNAANEAIRPRAVIKNFGATDASRVNVSFEILKDGQVVWGPHRAPGPISLAAQASAVVSTSEYWPTSAGNYQLRVRTWIDSAVGPGGAQGLPQTDVASGNDQGLIHFTSADRRDVAVLVLPGPGSTQTDLDGSKSGEVVLENRGNVAVSGTLEVFYDTLDATVSPAVRRNVLIPIAPARNVVVPYGKALTVIGGETDTAQFAWAWNQRTSASDPTPVPSGIYAIVARFTPDNKDAAMGIREGESVVYVRATPLAALQAGFPPPSVLGNPSPYPVFSRAAAVESVGWGQVPGWSTRAWAFLTTPHPTTFGVPNDWEAVRPVSPTASVPALQGTGVWAARGEDCRTVDGSVCLSGSSNLIDWYVLRKDLVGTMVPADATRLDVSFASEGWFDFYSSEDANRTRGFVRILPKAMDAAVDQARAAGETTGLPGRAPGAVLSYRATAHPCGRLENMTVAVGGTPFNMLSLVLEQPHAWRDCNLRAGLSWLGSREIAVEWIYETNRTRLASQRGEVAPCELSPADSIEGQACSTLTRPVADRWYMDRAILTLSGGATTSTHQDGAEVPGDGAGSSRAFFNCAYLSAAGERTTTCRGWTVEGLIEAAGKNNKAVATSFPSNWYVETAADRDGTGTVLRYGYLPYDQAAVKGPSEVDGYGTEGRLGDPIVVSVARSPAFTLAGLNKPTLTFWANFTLSPCASIWDLDRPEELRSSDGFNVWMVLAKDGQEVRAPLFPEGNYTHRLYGGRSTNRPAPAVCESPDIALRKSFNPYFVEGGTYRRPHPYGSASDMAVGKNGKNVWSDTSNPDERGNPRWMQPTFNLSGFAGPEWAGWSLAVEFQVVAQAASRSGFLRIDDVRVGERAAANDLAVDAILHPPAGRLVGPGQQQVIVARVSNAGLFDQSGIAVRYEIHDRSGRLVKAQTRTLEAERVLAGALSERGERTEDVAFTETWTPVGDGAYTLTVRALLNESLRPYADTNPINDVQRLTIHALNLSALRIQPFASVPDDALITPIIAGVGEARSIKVPVENVGTLPINFDGDRLGDLAVRVVVRNEDGDTVATLRQALSRLDVGRTLTLEFKDAWRPTASGLYTVDMDLEFSPGAAAAMVGDLSFDNSRRLKVLVFNRILPATDEAWSAHFLPGGAGWRQDATRTGDDGWTWGGPYDNLQSGVLAMKDLVNLRSIRNLFLVIDHRYAFEEGFDAGLVEATVDGGLTWRPVPPRGGYPVALSTASPLVPDPFLPVSGFSGSTGDYVAYDLDLGAVPGLRRTVSLLDADFQGRNPFAATGTGCVAAEGATAPADCLTLAPKDGAGMWFSDKYALSCIRKVRVRVYNGSSEVPAAQFNSNVAFPAHVLQFPNPSVVYVGEAAAPVNSQPWWVSRTPISNIPQSFSQALCRAPWNAILHEVPWARPGGFTWMMRWETIPPNTPGEWVAGENTIPILDTTKTLRVPLTLPEGTRELALSFWDWRAIGQTVQVRLLNQRYLYTSTTPSTISARIVDATGAEIVPLIPPDSDGQDAYRDWTLNTFRLDDYAPLLASQPVFLEFQHRLSSSYTGQAFGGSSSEPIIQADPGDTDWLSPHIGWALDEIRVEGNGGVTLLHNGAEAGQTASPLPTHRTRCHVGKDDKQNAAACPWTTVLDSDGDGTDNGTAGWQARGQLLGAQVWRVEPGLGLVARPSVARASADRLVPSQIGRISGDDARLVLPLDLKSAVGTTVLELNASWKFTDFLGRENSGLVKYAGSGAVVEVSRDGGATWVPLTAVGTDGKPVARATACAAAASASTHTPLAGQEKDPQRNSRFGRCTSVIGGQTVAGQVQQLSFDLTDFAGKEVLVGFHVFFTTNREVAGTRFPLAGPDHWTIRDLRVRGAILDAADLGLRLRAGSDSSVAHAGWDIRKVEFLGVKHTQNLAVRVETPGRSGLIPQDRVNFTVEVINKGQVPSTGTRLAIWVNATDAQGQPDPRYSEVYAGPLSAFTPCILTDRITGDALAPESSADLCGMGEDPLAFDGLAGYSYTIAARVSDAGYANDAILADNAHGVALPQGSVLASSQLRFTGLTVSPNTYRPADGEPVVVTADVLNRGLGKSSLDSITLLLTAPDGTERVLNPERLETLFNPLQAASFRWVLGPEALDPARGRGVWMVTATVVTQGGAVDSSHSRLYLGSTPLTDLGFDDRVRLYDIQSDVKDRWYAETVSICGAERPWYVHEGTSGGFTNNSREWAFALPPQGFTGGDGGGGPCTQSNILRTPRIAINPEHLAGPDGVPRLFLNFWSRHSFDSQAYGRVELRVFDGTEVDQAPTAIPGIPPRGLYVMNFTDESYAYGAGKFTPFSIDLLAWLRDPEYPDGTVRNKLKTFTPRYVEVYFSGYGRLSRGWQIDDVSLTPFAVSVGPAQSYPAVDDTDKEYRLVIRNQGAYTDSYQVNITDAQGRAPSVPAGWHVVILDSLDRVLWHSGSLVPPAGCNPLPLGASGLPVVAPSLRLDPGQSEIVRAKVCIPISEAQAGRSNSVTLGITATSLTHPYHRSTSPLTLSYTYSERPNLLIPVGGFHVDNADLPVDQPRTVSVTVLNAGTVTAQNVVVRVTDSMDAAFGYQPIVLTGVDGKPAAALSALPSREARTFTFLWTPRATGEHNLTVELDPEDAIRELKESDNFLRFPVFITKAEYPDLVVSVESSSLSPPRGEPTELRLVIENRGGKAATGIQLTFKAGVTDLLIHQGASADDFINRIAPGETVVVTRTWRPAFPGTIHVIGGALPRSGVLERADTQGDNYALLSVKVFSTDFQVDFAKPVLAGRQGEDLRATLRLTNPGQTDDELAVRVTAPTGVVPSLTRGGQRVTNLVLAKGENATLTLDLTLPARLAAGNYSVNVTVRSVHTGASSTGALTLVVLPAYALAVEASPVAAPPGVVAVPVTVRNEGNAADWVEVRAAALPAGWTAQPARALLAPFGKGVATLNLTVPGSQPAGVYEVFLVAQDAAGAAANGTLLLDLAEREAIGLEMAGSLRGVRPGQVVEAALRVRNEGNVRAEGALQILAPTGWRATLGRSLVGLEVGQEVLVPATVSVPRSAEPGRFNLSLEATGLRSNRSGAAQVVVTESDLKVADLTFTPRVNVAPGALVTFNASIVNVGIPAHNVTVALYADDFLVGVEKLPVVGGTPLPVTFGWVAQPGEHVLLLLVDPGNVLEEGDEANNARLEVLRTSGGEGILAAARNTVPDAGLLAGLGAVALAAVAVARRNLRRQ